MPPKTKTKVMQPVGNKIQLQFVVDHEASKKAVIKRSAIFEERKKNGDTWEKRNVKHLAWAEKNVKGWKVPTERKK